MGFLESGVSHLELLAILAIWILLCRVHIGVPHVGSLRITKAKTPETRKNTITVVFFLVKTTPSKHRLCDRQRVLDYCRLFTLKA